MVYILFVLFFILGILIPRNVLVKYALLGFIFVISAYNFDNPDYLNYENMYYFVGSGTYTGQILDFGYVFLVKLANFLGLDYSGFLLVYFAICTFFILKIVNLYSLAPNRVLVFFLLYPLCINVIQLRFFLASLVIIYALKYLAELNLKSFTKFTAFLFTAISLHFSSLIFAVFYLLFVKNRKYFFLILSMLVVGVLVLAPFAVDILNVLSAGKLETYADGNYLTVNKIARAIFFTGTILVLLYMLKYYSEKADNFFSYEKTLIGASFIILLLANIAILFSNEFERYARVGYVLIYILFFNFLIKKYISTHIKFLSVIMFTVVIGSYIYFQYNFRFSNETPFTEAVFQQVIEYNSMIGLYEKK